MARGLATLFKSDVAWVALALVSIFRLAALTLTLSRPTGEGTAIG